MMKFIVLAIIICYTRGRPGDNIDKLVDNIFKTHTVVNTTQNTGDCRCVPYYLCDKDVILKNGEHVIDYRINNRVQQECGYLEACCKDSQETKQTDSAHFRTPPKKLQKCGVRNPEGVGFRVTRNDTNNAEFGEFPWMLVVYKYDKTQPLYHGGASLIHPQVALTAAHLISDTKNKFKVRAGDWDLQTNSEIFRHQDRDVVSIKVHPEFNSKTAFNDFALLFLNASFEISENVDVVCLPAPNTKVEAGTKCFTSGWGQDKFGIHGTYQTIPKKINIPVVPNEDCQKRLRGNRLGDSFELGNTFMCAGGDSTQDSCKGDGGGPLVCPVLNHTGIYEQYGIVSWGIGCGEPKLPGVYSAVSKVVDWIEKEMKSHKLDLAYNKF